MTSTFSQHVLASIQDPVYNNAIITCWEPHQPGAVEDLPHNASWGHDTTDIRSVFRSPFVSGLGIKTPFALRQDHCQRMITCVIRWASTQGNRQVGLIHFFTKFLFGIKGQVG